MKSALDILAYRRSLLVQTGLAVALYATSGGVLWPQWSTGSSGTIYYDGSVGIGTTSPAHLLHVAGTIGAVEVLVTATGADYVFAPDYHLPSLPELAAHNRENHHGLGIASAAEVQQKGVSLGDMQSKLLAKSSTLHLIQAEEKNRDLEARLARLESRYAAGSEDASMRR